jgi:hypothetical protein
LLAALAYTAVGTLLPRAAAAVGDRVFPLTVVLTQAAPSDTLYVTPSTRPALGGGFLNLIPLSTKPFAERFGIGIQNRYNCIGRKDASTLVG